MIKFDKTLKQNGMSTFNKNFFNPNISYTREMAEQKMVEKGYSDFHYKGCSFSNGASFYFDVNGKEVRVSDHSLTGRRAFDTIQISFVEPKTLPSKRRVVKDTEPMSDVIARMIAKKK